MSAVTAVRTATRLLRGGLPRRGRLVFTGAVGVGVVLLALGANLADVEAAAVRAILMDAGLQFFVPVATLTFASACLGDLVEDDTLVYLWLRPVPRWQLALAATTAALQVTAPLVVGVMAVAALAGGAPDALAGIVAASALGVAAYGGLFVALGLRTTRSLVWGLGYVLIWEGLLSNLAAPFARFSLRRYVASTFTQVADVTARRFETSLTHAVVVLVVVALVGTLLAAHWLRSREVA